MTVNRKYLFLEGFYWIIYCIVASYLTLYLQKKGFNNKSIGMVTATFGIVSAILQPVLGRVCDKSRHFTWKSLLLMLIGVYSCLCILMLVIPGRMPSAVLIGLLLLTGNLMTPLVNGAMSYYKQNGEDINFGAARGIGSGLYALSALLVGNLAGIYGTNVIPIICLIFAVFLLPVILSMPCKHQNTEKIIASSDTENGFAKRYPAFLVMTAAFVLLAISHNMIEIYLLQIIQSLGGGSKELGSAMAIRSLTEIPVLFGFVLLLKRFRARTLLTAASVGYGVKAVMYLLARNMTAIYLVQFTQIISYAIYASASVYYVLDTVDDRDQITGQALMASTMTIGKVVGSLVGGYILDASGISRMLQINIVFSAAGIILAFVACSLSHTSVLNKPVFR